MKKYVYFIVICLISSILVFQNTAFAISAEQKKLIDGGIMYYDYEQCDPSSSSVSLSGGSLDRFLQVLAYQESRGNPTIGAGGSSASGKYQYVSGTWKARASLYGPAGQYTSAGQAPEEVQDAVAYIEYTQVFNSLGGDFAKLAINHYLPAALTDPTRMDVVPNPEAGNKYTPREYGNMMLENMQKGVGSDIPLKYKQAPEFDIWLQKVGGTPTPLASSSSSASSKIIALDPGHGAVVNNYIDPVTKLGDRETANSPEREDMQDVANQVKTQLEGLGYKVVMLKNLATDAVSKRQRIDLAKANKVDLGISLHSDSGSGSFEGWAEVWPQFVGGYRQSSSDQNIKVTFTNQEVADTSNSISDVFATERDKAERSGSGVTKKVVGQAGSFSKNRGLPSFGDLSLMQLWANDIPWVYNEVGAPASGLTSDQKSKYASGIINSVRASMPPSGQDTTSECGSGSGSSMPQGNGDAIATALTYAWPDYRGRGFVTPKSEYAEAISRAKASRSYIGGIRYPGIDCGGFVTRVMLDSGYEPGYNNAGKGGATATQLQWARENWQLVGRGNTLSTIDLLPGDVAFRVTSSGANDGHTFMYVGTQAGFGDDIASASLDTRAPMAGRENPLSNDIEWYRKK